MNFYCSIFAIHDQFIYTRYYVFLLRTFNDSQYLKVLVVEEVFDHPSIGEYFNCLLYTPFASFIISFILQVQFCGAMSLGLNGIRDGCDFPLWMQYALVIYMFSFIVLFGNFYAKMYLSKGKKNVKSGENVSVTAKISTKHFKQKSN